MPGHPLFLPDPFLNANPRYVCGRLGTLDVQGAPTLFPGPREEQSLERVPEPAERARLVKIL